MIHRIEPEIRNLQGRLSRERAPILTIEPGDTIVAGTRCCEWESAAPAKPNTPPPEIPKAERADPVNDVGNCLIGPIAVRGARPEMTLEVEIEELQLGAFGVTIVENDARERCQRLGIEPKHVMTWAFDHGAGVARNPQGHAIPVRPFLGHLGNTPDLPGYHSNLAPGRYGGNMDCKDLVVGSKLYLPIEVPGALFTFGDGHAAQGDGEICGTAIECPMDPVRLTLRLRDDMPLEWPAAKTPAGWITFGFDNDLSKAAFIALNGMLDIITRELRIPRNEAALIASLAVDLRITQIVNPTMGVHAVWRVS